MVDITTIPQSELMQDLADSFVDVKHCEAALAVGITKYSGGSVQERLDVNLRIIQKITAELKRREAQLA